MFEHTNIMGKQPWIDNAARQQRSDMATAPKQLSKYSVAAMEVWGRPSKNMAQ
jgi:hypothetical protein